MSIIVKLEIPEDFRIHWDMDRFCDSFSRISTDITWSLTEGDGGLAGRYEAELADMLKNAFLKAEVIDGKEVQTDNEEGTRGDGNQNQGTP